MISLIQTDKNRVVVGLGITGLSTMRFLKKLGLPFTAFDTRADFVLADDLRQEFYDVEFLPEKQQASALSCANEIYLSPGIALNDPIVGEINLDASITGDLDLFITHAQAPVVAITGSNAKSTVTELLGEMAAMAKLNVGVGGNLGKPMLNLIDTDRELYILELSSFQLERAKKLNLQVACILNVSEDHLDRHGSMMQYYQIKQRIYRGAKISVFNRDDKLTLPLNRIETVQASFGVKAQSLDDFEIKKINGISNIVRRGEALLSENQIALSGQHNLMNIMAALVIGEAIGLTLDDMLDTAKTFKGLMHRCEYVATIDKVVYINDSKATNVGATIAALQGLESTTKGRIVLIAGGETKNADFSELAREIQHLNCKVVLLGKGAVEIQRLLDESLDTHIVSSLEEAVSLAQTQSQPNDIVLLSPACASFDMFKNYKQRGERFKMLVNDLQQNRQNNGDQL